MTFYVNYTWIKQWAKVKWGSPLSVILFKPSDSLNQLRQSYITRQIQKRKASLPEHFDHLRFMSYRSQCRKCVCKSKQSLLTSAIKRRYKPMPFRYVESLLSTCSPLTAQKLGGITTNGFPVSLPLAMCSVQSAFDYLKYYNDVARTSFSHYSLTPVYSRIQRGSHVSDIQTALTNLG